MAEQGNLSHSSDTCQRLTSEAKRTDMFQVINPGYLTRRMPGKRQLQLIARDTRAIIRHTDKLQTAVHQINPNLFSSSINAVFDQFFDNGRGSLNHFSR